MGKLLRRLGFAISVALAFSMLVMQPASATTVSNEPPTAIYNPAGGLTVFYAGAHKAWHNDWDRSTNSWSGWNTNGEPGDTNYTIPDVSFSGVGFASNLTSVNGGGGPEYSATPFTVHPICHSSANMSSWVTVNSTSSINTDVARATPIVLSGNDGNGNAENFVSYMSQGEAHYSDVTANGFCPSLINNPVYGPIGSNFSGAGAIFSHGTNNKGYIADLFWTDSFSGHVLASQYALGSGNPGSVADLGGVAKSGPAAVSRFDSNGNLIAVTVFVLGQDTELYQNVSTNGISFSGWSKLTTNNWISGAGCVTDPQTTNVLCAESGTDGHVYADKYIASTNTWTGFFDLGSPPGT